MIPNKCPKCGSTGLILKMGRHTDEYWCDEGGHSFILVSEEKSTISKEVRKKASCQKVDEDA